MTVTVSELIELDFSDLEICIILNCTMSNLQSIKDEDYDRRVCRDIDLQFFKYVLNKSDRIK